MPQTTQPCASWHVRGGTISAGTIINGGLGVDTFTPGTLKGGLGSTTFYHCTAGDRIIWSAAGATGLLDGNDLDVAYAGQGDDQFDWRNAAAARASRTSARRSTASTSPRGDDLNVSEFTTAAFAGVRRGFAGANDLVNWVNLSLTGTGDTVVQFRRVRQRQFHPDRGHPEERKLIRRFRGDRSQRHRRAAGGAGHVQHRPPCNEPYALSQPGAALQLRWR
jgi:hypothetical protein